MADPRGRAGAILGDYRLDLLLEDGEDTLTWLAEQQSIQRPVVLVELKPGSMEHRDAFLEDIRTKAAIDQPVMGSIYEAVSDGEQCFVVLERLPGSTLADRAAAKEPLQPLAMVHLLSRLAEVMLRVEAAATNTLPLSLGTIYLDPHGILRLANIACAGVRPPGRSVEDIAILGKGLRRMVADGRPGASRVTTLLAWMRGEGLPQRLNWTMVRDYALQIEQQLTEPVGGVPATAPVKKKKSKAAGAIGGGVLALAAAAAVYFAMRGSGEPKPVDLPPAVDISAGTHPTPDGEEEDLASFQIGGHEVTVREYREFLDAVKRLPADFHDTYDVEGQPKTKTGHEPQDWDAMLAAAKSGGTWQGLPMSLECPVVNVDWWDAAAYCKYRSGRLPTQEEWFAALRTQNNDPAHLKAAPWGPVQQIPPSDRTDAGLYGMAGSVAEWTQDVAINPANPLGAKSHVISGGSYLRRGSGSGSALAREFTDDLMQRRPDLGFRLVTSGQ